MRKPVLFAVLASASILSWTAANIRADGEEDAAANLLQEAREQGKRAAPASAPADEGLWASFDPADISADFPLQSPVARSGAAAIYRLEESQLLQVSDYMHRKYHRCGGFFAYRTRMDAENAFAAPLSSAGGPYTIDQQAWGKPLIARVRESEIRATIEGLAGFASRYYTSDSGVAAAKWL